MGSHNITAVSPIRAAQLSIPKKNKNRKTERGKFTTPPRPTGRQSNYTFLSIISVMLLASCKDHRSLTSAAKGVIIILCAINIKQFT